MKRASAEIVKAATKFHNELKRDEFGRYRSWEHCYTSFADTRNDRKPDYDYLSLQLAFYLASWGMYRGSSFLLQKDYQVHTKAVKRILSKKYDCLSGIDCSGYYDSKKMQLLMELSDFLQEYYDEVRKDIKGDLQNDISKTLITKILMGTLACVPAYDRYFVAGVKHFGITTGNYNSSSILKLVDYYQDHFDLFEKTRSSMKVGRRQYPQMKMIDMGFWKIGYDLDNNPERFY